MSARPRNRIAAFAATGMAGWLLFAQVKPDPITFEDTSSAAGVEFVLQNSAAGDKHQIEAMVSGVAVFDFDNDGWPDLYFVNGARQPSLEKSGAYSNRLYRNRGGGTFADVTARAGVPGHGFETGVAVADFDNDGAADLFLAGVNRNTLYRNRGDGTFEDVTKPAGFARTPAQAKFWSVSAGWFDYDGDGWLDLFVVNYVVWPEKEPSCAIGKVRTYCHPRYYEGLPISSITTIATARSPTFRRSRASPRTSAKAWGWLFSITTRTAGSMFSSPTIRCRIFYFTTRAGGRFQEVGLRVGVAFNEDGRALSSMGADARDLDDDGREDLWVTANAGESFPLFRNLGKGLMMDVTYPSGIGRHVMLSTGWSNGIFDFNNDGRKDLFAACSAIDDNTEQFSDRKSKQPNRVLANLGNMTFEDVSASAGSAFQEPGAHRGAAFGDFDRDGRVDAVVSRIGGRAELFRNTSPVKNHWLALRLRGHRSNRDGLGAMIHVTALREQWNRVTTATGYGSSSDRTVFFGTGKDTVVQSVEILWPSGLRQKLANVKTDQYLDVEEPQD